MKKNTLYILKIGGKQVEDEDILHQILHNFAQRKGAKILVHGGARKATEFSKQLGIAPNIVDGRRITDAATLEIVTMVYGGLFNKKIVSQLQAQDCNAIGLTGADGNAIQAYKRPVKTIDYGYVGDIEQVNVATIKTLLDGQFIPIFCALTHDKKGQMLNTNSDTIAAQIAIAMADEYAVNLNYCFEKKGVLTDPENNESYIPQLNYAAYQDLLTKGIISDGMLPKLDNAFQTLKQGVHKVILGDFTSINGDGGTHLSL